jgi:uncharacterized Zn finger protein
MAWYYGFKPYVSVAQRRAKAAAYAARLANKERRALAPIKIEGRTIASSFWGNAWCENLERYSDFSSRLPRGRTYVRNGSVIDLQIERGNVRAIVSGSEIYRVHIEIKTLAQTLWKKIKRDCGQSVASLIDLLQGRFDQGVMQRLTQHDGGLFPKPAEITMTCSCPDWAGMCKHVAAVLYGVGARLDASPELLFSLRNVDHLDLINQATSADNLNRSLAGKGNLAPSNLEEIFGIEIDQDATTPSKPRARRPVRTVKPSSAVPLPSTNRAVMQKATMAAPAGVTTKRQRSQRKAPRPTPKRQKRTAARLETRSAK